MNPVKMENRETIRCCWILFDTGRKYITHGWWYVLRFSLPLTSPPLLTHPFHFGVVHSLVPVCCALSSTFLTKSHCADYTRLRVRMQGGIRISVRLSFPYRMNSNRHGEDNTREFGEPRPWWRSKNQWPTSAITLPCDRHYYRHRKRFRLQLNSAKEFDGATAQLQFKYFPPKKCLPRTDAAVAVKFKRH